METTTKGRSKRVQDAEKELEHQESLKRQRKQSESVIQSKTDQEWVNELTFSQLTHIASQLQLSPIAHLKANALLELILSQHSVAQLRLTFGNLKDADLYHNEFIHEHNNWLEQWKAITYDWIVQAIQHDSVICVHEGNHSYYDKLEAKGGEAKDGTLNLHCWFRNDFEARFNTFPFHCNQYGIWCHEEKGKERYFIPLLKLFWSYIKQTISIKDEIQVVWIRQNCLDNPQQNGFQFLMEGNIVYKETFVVQDVVQDVQFRKLVGKMLSEKHDDDEEYQDPIEFCNISKSAFPGGYYFAQHPQWKRIGKSSGMKQTYLKPQRLRLAGKGSRALRTEYIPVLMPSSLLHAALKLDQIEQLQYLCDYPPEFIEIVKQYMNYTIFV